MNQVTITEKYALCMLKEKGKLEDSEVKPHLLVSMIVEMMLDGNLEITDKNKVKITSDLPITPYNKQLYEIIGEMKKDEVPLKTLLTSLCNEWPEKKMKAIVALFKDSMEKKDLIRLEHKKGLFGEKEVIVINEKQLDHIVEEVRSEFLEKGALTDDLVLLGALLNSTKFLKSIFTKYEKNALNSRLKEIKDTEIAEKVKVARSVIDDMAAMLIAIVVTTIN